MQKPTRIIVIPLFYLCNARCKMCNIWMEPGTPRWEPATLRQVLADPALSKNAEVVNVTGGEPTLRKDLLEVIQAIVEPLEALHTLSIQTHGLNPSLVKSRIGPVVEWIRALGLTSRKIHLDINISLDGPDGIHDEVRGRKGAFRSVLESLSIARSLLEDLDHSAIMFNCTIVRQNVRHLRETQKIADELGVEITYTVPQVTDTYMANSATSDQFTLSEAERIEASTFLKELLDRTQGSAALSQRYCSMLVELLETGKRNIGCPLAEGGLFLEPDGKALPCWRSSSLLLGNVFEDSVSSLLEARGKPEYRERLETLCSSCPSNCYVDWTRRMFARRIAQGVL